jgi:hypothetical protein
MRRALTLFIVCAGLAGCQTPFQGGEIFIFDYQIRTVTSAQDAIDLANSLGAGAPAADMLDRSRPVCRVAFSGPAAPEINRGGLPGETGASLTVFRAQPDNVSTLDVCGHEFRDLFAVIGPDLPRNTPILATSFALAIDSASLGAFDMFEQDAIRAVLTDFDPATLVYEGEFEVVATTASDPSRVLIVSEGRFVLR